MEGKSHWESIKVTVRVNNWVTLKFTLEENQLKELNSNFSCHFSNSLQCIKMLLPFMSLLIIPILK